MERGWQVVQPVLDRPPPSRCTRRGVGARRPPTGSPAPAIGTTAPPGSPAALAGGGHDDLRRTRDAPTRRDRPWRHQHPGRPCHRPHHLCRAGGPPCRTPAAAGPAAVISACAAAARDAAGGTPDGIAIGIPGPARPRARGGLRRPPPPRLREPPRPGDALRGRRVPGRHPQRLESRRLRGVGGRDGTRDPDLRLRHHRHWHRRCRDHRRNPPGRHCQHRGRGRARALQHGRTALRPGPSGCLEGIASGTGIARAAAAPSPRARIRGCGGHPSRRLGHRRRGRAGDPLAARVYAEAGRALGRSFGALVNIWARTPSPSVEGWAATPTCFRAPSAPPWRRSPSTRRSGTAGWVRPSWGATRGWSGPSPGRCGASARAEAATTLVPGS